MNVIAVSLVSLVLAIACVLVHYEAFKMVASSARSAEIGGFPSRGRLLIVIFGALAAHTVEITFYGFVFWGLHSCGLLGEIVGKISDGWIDFLYFSITNYTTLGVGDIRAEGPMRLIASSEALTGLVLLSWTASFTYLSMENFWKRR
ncbi:two pore domain potassium channel family protein [Mesorhizobium sp. B2-5-4]|uniref:ion channel n=1 Tax=unclassified Mesorhizobium TaxID=325217 RepID=UPI00112B1F8F|nr:MULTISPECIES: ion channel [unclassified Mesorhizobium]TPJ88141.1 two pore domain potassium channel family protein [Mesorhizobium sp. B2-5-13]TPK44740.1 two pore domain potassium channel family protein [Mesorhizobium sp. B2-5-4]TPK52336.1 two pore domain potassium channel family protein [Mesorhizobium sp. B2-5-5]TPM05411.1 two pore domain potassium channel family protein [Mesorhizobium sp. B2-3-11]